MQYCNTLRTHVCTIHTANTSIQIPTYKYKCTLYTSVRTRRTRVILQYCHTDPCTAMALAFPNWGFVAGSTVPFSTPSFNMYTCPLCTRVHRVLIKSYVRTRVLPHYHSRTIPQVLRLYGVRVYLYCNRVPVLQYACETSVGGRPGYKTD